MGRTKILFAAALLFSGAVLLFGRVPSLTNDFCNPDIADISYGANDLLAGGTIYPHCAETKPPGVYLIFAACFALFGQKLVPIYLLAALFHLITMIVIARMAEKAGGRAAGAFAALFYACLAIDWSFEANCPDHETWLAFIAAWGFALLPLQKADAKTWRLVASGMMFAAALLMKQQAVLFIAAAGAWIFLARPLEWKVTSKHGAWFGAGWVAALAPVAAGWFLRGGLGTMIHELNPGRLGHYVAVKAAGEVAAAALLRIREHLPSGWPIWVMVVAGAVLWAMGRDEKKRFLPHLLYLLAAIGAVAAGSRFFRHYMIVLAAPLALAAGSGAGLAAASLKKTWRVAAGVCLALVTLGASYPAFRLSAEMLRELPRSGLAVTEDLLKFSPDTDPNLSNRFKDRDDKRLGRYLADQTRPGDTIYVWPYVPQLYFWSGLRAPTRHYVYFEVAADLPFKHGGWYDKKDDAVQRNRSELLSNLSANPPVFVVLPAIDEAWDRPFEELETWVASRYALDADTPAEDLRVFKKR